MRSEKSRRGGEWRGGKGVKFRRIYISLEN